MILLEKVDIRIWIKYLCSKKKKHNIDEDHYDYILIFSLFPRDYLIIIIIIIELY